MILASGGAGRGLMRGSREREKVEAPSNATSWGKAESIHRRISAALQQDQAWADLDMQHRSGWRCPDRDRSASTQSLRRNVLGGAQRSPFRRWSRRWWRQI